MCFRKTKQIRTSLLAILIFIFFCSFYLLTSSGIILTADGLVKLEVTQSIIEKGDFSVSKNNGILGIDGKYYTNFDVGFSLFLIPFYLIGKLIGLSLFSNFPIRFSTKFVCSMLNPIVTALTCCLIFIFGNGLGYNPRRACFLSVLYGIGTMAWAYTKIFYAEPLVALLLLTSAYALFIYQENKRLLWLTWSSIFLGMAIMTRIISCIVIPIMLLYILMCFLMDKKRNGKRVIVELISFCLILGFFLILVGLYNKIRFGSFLKSGWHVFTKEQLFPLGYLRAPLFSGIFGMLLSPGCGLFLYNPILILFFGGIAKLYRKHKAESLLFILIILFHISVYVKWYCWWGGEGWGPRYLVSILPFMILPLGNITFAKNKDILNSFKKIAVIILIVLSVLIQISSIAVSHMRYILKLHFNVYSEAKQKNMNEFQVLESKYFIIKASPLIWQWASLYEVVKNLQKKGLLKSLREKHDFSEQRPSFESVNNPYHIKNELVLNSPHFWFFYLYFFGLPLKLILIVCLGLVLIMFASLRFILRLVG